METKLNVSQELISRVFWFNLSRQLKEKGYTMQEAIMVIQGKRELKDDAYSRYINSVALNKSILSCKHLFELSSNFGIDIQSLFDVSLMKDNDYDKVDLYLQYKFNYHSNYQAFVKKAIGQKELLNSLAQKKRVESLRENRQGKELEQLRKSINKPQKITAMVTNEVLNTDDEVVNLDDYRF